MKNIILLLFATLAIPALSTAQESTNKELTYGIYRVFPPLSITTEQLQEAQTLLDLNKFYKPSWVRAYLSVEIRTHHDGKTRKAMGENDVLTPTQKDHMQQADVGTDISVLVRYMPENNLTQNDPKEFDFTFSVDQENEAAYIGGEQALQQYLKEKIIDKIPDGTLRQYQLAVVKFAISAEGEILNPHLFWASEDDQTDALLVDGIRKMPCWEPGAYPNGTKVKQEFVLLVGDLASCVLPTLNIRLDWLATRE